MKIICTSSISNKKNNKIATPDHLNQFNDLNKSQLLNIIIIYIFLSGLLISFAFITSFLFHGFLNINLSPFTWLLILILPYLYDFIQGFAYGKNAEPIFYFSISKFDSISYNKKPITKKCYLFASLCPYLILVFIPLITWLILPHEHILSSPAITFYMMSLIAGFSYWIKINIVLKQMPKQSYFLMVNFDEFWFVNN
ncbi:MAG: hypothetical protein FWE90_11655 [Defluviitaleaceae bacterium]|nr:hypothetical protein [Defluviitaleaceae bacterium]